MRRQKKVACTASTGMARLQFIDGKTLHSWSGYGDGHVPVEEIIQEIKISALYQETKQNIIRSDVLIIDEIGMISAHILDTVEKICRSIRDINKPFGGLQVIAGGSFVQLPPVPSHNDKGMYAFQSTNFKNIFPHKIHLNVVHRQKEMDLINAINLLCEGIPTTATHAFMRSFKRSLENGDNAVHIFGCNYDVDFFNVMTLNKLPGNEVMFSAEDIAVTCAIHSCNAPKYLPLKVGCKVIVIRNLENGLVNGISAHVEEIHDQSVVIRTEIDKYLNHNLQGRLFHVHKYSFMQRNVKNENTAIRKQLPLKLGYAITVDKSQGRTLPQVVIDSSNFWRPGQLGVAVGRAITKDGLQLITYNQNAAELKHLKCVQDFYLLPSYLMRQDLSCCQNKNIDDGNVRQHVAQIVGLALPTIPNYSENFNYMENVTVVDFPFDLTQYVSDFIKKQPQFTVMQKEQINLIKEFAHKECFKVFLAKAYSMVKHLFTCYNISNKKSKCNWCRLCAHLHAIFFSKQYHDQIMAAFGSSILKKNENSICTKIYFDILEMIASNEAHDVRQQKMNEFLHMLDREESMDNLHLSSLRDIAGACIHSVRNTLGKLATNQIMNKQYEAQINHRKRQLTTKLIGPPSQIERETLHPESLIKLLLKDTGGLLYVTDECFNFFKLLCAKSRKLQHVLAIQLDPENIFLTAYNTLTTDADLLNEWFALFADDSQFTSNTCTCTEDSTESYQCDSNELLSLELDQILILELMQKVVIYFCKVHLNEKVTQLKDFMLEKPKTFQHRHTVEFKSTQNLPNPEVEYPCGVCNKECIDIIHDTQAKFEEFSVQCNKCNKWYHYICMNLNGNEPELQENSSLPYFCTFCKRNTAHEDVDDHANNSESNLAVTDDQNSEELEQPNVPKCVTGRGRRRGHGRGRGHGHACGRGSGHRHGQPDTEMSQGQATSSRKHKSDNKKSLNENDPTPAHSRSGRQRKPVHKMDL